MRLTITLPTPKTEAERAGLPEQSEAARLAVAAAYGVAPENVTLSVHQLRSIARPNTSQITRYILDRSERDGRGISLTNGRISSEIGVHSQMLEKWKRHGFTELDHERYPSQIAALERAMKEFYDARNQS